MKESEKLLEALCKSPEDWELRLILADAYEEEGNLEYAQSQRWMSNNRKRANDEDGPEGVRTWYTLKKAEKLTLDPESDIPEELLKLLEGNTQETLRHYYKDFPDIQTSEIALMEAWKNLEVMGQ